MWHSPGNALWQQPGSPCEVTPRLWHEECPAASSPFPSRLFESSGPRTPFAPTHPGGRQHRRRCPAVSGRSCLPSTVPASSTQDLERPAPLRAVAYMPGRTLTRSPPSRPPPGPSLAARAFPAVAPGPSTPRVSRRTSTPSPPPGPQLAANACPAAVLGPTTGPLNSGPRVPLHPPNDRLHIRTLSPSPSGRLPPCSRPTARASPAAMPGILDFGPRVRTFWRMPLEPLVFGPRAATPALVHLRPGATTRRSAAPPADGRPRLPCRRSGPINPGPRVPALAFFFPPIPGLPRAFLHASSPPPYLPRPIRPCGPPPELQPTPRAALFPRTRHSRPHPGLPLLSYPVGTPRALPVPDDALEPCTRLVTAHTGSPQWPRTHGRPLVPRPGPLLDRPDHHGEPHGKCLNESVAARDNHARVAAARPSVDLNSIPQPLTCAPPLLPAP